MKQYGEIKFETISDLIGEGTYEGRRFLILAPEPGIDEGEPIIAESEFSEEEQDFILGQWEELRCKD